MSNGPHKRWAPQRIRQAPPTPGGKLKLTKQQLQIRARRGQSDGLENRETLRKSAVALTKREDQWPSIR